MLRAPMTNCAGPIWGPIHPSQDPVVPAVKVETGASIAAIADPYRPSPPTLSFGIPTEQRYRGDGVCPTTVGEFAERCSCHVDTE